MTTANVFADFSPLTQDLSSWDSTTGSVSYDAAKGAIKGPSTGSGVTKNNVFSDAGFVIAIRVQFDTLPTGAGGRLFGIFTSGGLLVCGLTMGGSTGKLTIAPQGATAATGTAVLAINTIYDIVLAGTVTSQSVFQFDVYVNGVLDKSASAGTLTRVGCSQFQMIAGAGLGTTNVWWSDIVINNDTGRTFPGRLRTTAKLAIANGTANGMTGSGTPSGTGTGNARYVNDRSLSQSDFVAAVVGVGVPVTEEYNVQARSAGDVDLTYKTITDFGGFLFAKALASESASMVLDGATSAVALTSTPTGFMAFAGKTSYPAGTGTDIGLVTTGAATTVTVYGAGILLIYLLASTYPVTPAGGVQTGGAGPATMKRVMSGSGGVQMSGVGPATSRRACAPAGGAQLGGAGPVTMKRVVIAAGGALMGGAGAVAARRAIVGAGGPQTGGSGPTTSRRAVTSLGGVQTSGAGSVTQSRRWIPSGGAQIAGSAPVAARRVILPTGGVSLSGAGLGRTRRVVIPLGGVVLGGSVAANRVMRATPVGGIHLGGTAPVVNLRVFVVTPTGGVLLAGAAAVAFLGGAGFNVELCETDLLLMWPSTALVPLYLPRTTLAVDDPRVRLALLDPSTRIIFPI